ncbi:hypothetical protein GbCGDNIH6_8299 [Granulibacter bethesdensis]|nr:hypothetical protein GbCGDNIH6_8299 [Granulibacter bethesdensis]
MGQQGGAGVFLCHAADVACCARQGKRAFFMRIWSSLSDPVLKEGHAYSFRHGDANRRCRAFYRVA